MRRDAYSLTRPKFLAATCPVLAAKLAEKGRLEGSEMECDHLNRAAGDAFHRWRERWGV